MKQLGGTRIIGQDWICGFGKKNKNIYDKAKAIILKGYLSNSQYVSAANNTCLLYELEKNTTYKITKNTLVDRVYQFDTKDLGNGAYCIKVLSSATSCSNSVIITTVDSEPCYIALNITGKYISNAEELIISIIKL